MCGATHFLIERARGRESGSAEGVNTKELEGRVQQRRAWVQPRVGGRWRCLRLGETLAKGQSTLLHQEMKGIYLSPCCSLETCSCGCSLCEAHALAVWLKQSVSNVNTFEQYGRVYRYLPGRATASLRQSDPPLVQTHCPFSPWMTARSAARHGLRCPSTKKSKVSGSSRSEPRKSIHVCCHDHHHINLPHLPSGSAVDHPAPGLSPAAPRAAAGPCHPHCQHPRHPHHPLQPHAPPSPSMST